MANYKELLDQKNQKIIEMTHPDKQKELVLKGLLGYWNKDIKGRLNLIRLIHNWQEFSSERDG